MSREFMSFLAAPKASPATEPIKGVWKCYRAARNHFHNKSAMSPLTTKTTGSEKKFSSRDVVRAFLSALSPASVQPPILTDDIKRFGRVADFLVQSVEDRILTEEEADAVLKFIAERFAHRRLDEILANVSTPRQGAWFALHHQHQE